MASSLLMVAEYVLISWIPLTFKFTFPKKLHRGVNESYFHYLDGYTMYLQKCFPKAYELMFWVGCFFTIYSQWPQQEKKTQLQQINDIKNQ